MIPRIISRHFTAAPLHADVLRCQQGFIPPTPSAQRPLRTSTANDLRRGALDVQQLTRVRRLGDMWQRGLQFAGSLCFAPLAAYLSFTNTPTVSGTQQHAQATLAKQFSGVPFEMIERSMGTDWEQYEHMMQGRRRYWGSLTTSYVGLGRSADVFLDSMRTLATREFHTRKSKSPLGAGAALAVFGFHAWTMQRDDWAQAAATHACDTLLAIENTEALCGGSAGYMAYHLELAADLLALTEGSLGLTNRAYEHSAALYEDARAGNHARDDSFRIAHHYGIGFGNGVFDLCELGKAHSQAEATQMIVNDIDLKYAAAQLRTAQKVMIY